MLNIADHPLGRRALGNSVIAAACVAAFVLGGRLASAVTVGHVDSFDAGTTLTWEGDGLPTVIESGGPAGDGDSFIQVVANGGNGPGSKLAIFNRDEAWAGDYLSAGVTAVSVDMLNPESSQALDMRLVLFGDGGTRERWTSAEPFMLPNDGVWRTVVFPMDEASLTRTLGRSDYTTAMSDVVRVMVRHDSGTASASGTSVSAQVSFDNFSIVGEAPEPCCDFDQSGILDVGDVNLLMAEIRLANQDLRFDVNQDGAVSSDDLAAIVRDEFNTFIGDANLDGEFTTGDLVAVFAAGQYEDEVAGNSTWDTGDWDADGDFGTSDLVVAFADGGFEVGPRAAAVPEPTSLIGLTWLAVGLFAGSRIRRV